MVDAAASKYALFIDAAKMEIKVVGRLMSLPTLKLSGKEPRVTDSFKGMDVRNVRALAARRQFQDIWASPKLSNQQKMDVSTFDSPTFLYGCKIVNKTEVQMGRWEVIYSNCLCRVVGVKLTNRHRLETVGCGRWPHGTTEIQTGSPDYSGMYGSAIRGCHEERSGGDTTFRDCLQMAGRTKLIPWPKIREAAAECALDRHAWRDAIKNLAPLEFKEPKQRQAAGECDRVVSRPAQWCPLQSLRMSGKKFES
eukprot:300376-Chlamydomonas_euryale.AAC.1